MCGYVNRRKEKKTVWLSSSRWHRDIDKMNCIRTTSGLYLFIKDYFHLCVFVSICHMYVGACGGQERAGVTGYSESLDLDIRPIFSGRAVKFLNH